MTLALTDLALTRDRFNELFPLEPGEVVMAGGKRPGLTAAMVRHTVLPGGEHMIELGYGTVPERSANPKDYPLLLPRLDAQLGRFNIDGNINNMLILKFREKQGRKFVLQQFRNFNAPRAIDTGPEAPNAKLALAVLDIARLRVQEVLEDKINVQQDPQVFVNLVHHAIEMRAGHVLKRKTA